ncbi:hypothetical protein HKX48_002606, partial [Thoreauomyces humboldtii]
MPSDKEGTKIEHTPDTEEDSEAGEVAAIEETEAREAYRQEFLARLAERRKRRALPSPSSEEEVVSRFRREKRVDLRKGKGAAGVAGAKRKGVSRTAQLWELIDK